MSRERLDLDLIKRAYVSYNYESKFPTECINMMIVSIYYGYYEKIIKLNSPLSMISTDKYVRRDQKFAEVIKIDTNTHNEIIKIFRSQDEDGKILIRTSI